MSKGQTEVLGNTTCSGLQVLGLGNSLSGNSLRDLGNYLRGSGNSLSGNSLCGLGNSPNGNPLSVSGNSLSGNPRKKKKRKISLSVKKRLARSDKQETQGKGTQRKEKLNSIMKCIITSLRLANQPQKKERRKNTYQITIF